MCEHEMLVTEGQGATGWSPSTVTVYAGGREEWGGGTSRQGPHLRTNVGVWAVGYSLSHQRATENEHQTHMTSHREEVDLQLPSFPVSFDVLDSCFIAADLSNNPLT